MNNKIKALLLFLIATFIYQIAYAQFDEPRLSDWEALLKQVHGLKGFSFFFIGVISVQAIYLLLRTAVGDFLGVNKLYVLSFLSIAVTIISKVTSGAPLVEAIFDGPTLIAYQVFAHQYIKHRKEKSNDSEDNEGKPSDYFGTIGNPDSSSGDS